MAALPAWEFETAGDREGWHPNEQFVNVTVSGGLLHAEAVDYDPFFNMEGLEVPATPWQFVVIRMRADHAGTGELFWTGTTEGPYGGFTQEKTTRFTVPGDNAWHDIVLTPFWQGEGVIRKLRLDLYDAAAFDIDHIRILTWDDGEPPVSDVYAWEFGGDPSAWEIQPGSLALFAPPLELNVDGKPWVTVRLSSDVTFSAALVYAYPGVNGPREQFFAVEGDGQPHTYVMQVPWFDTVSALGLNLTAGASGAVSVESLSIADAPSGDPEIELQYFGFEAGVNRADKPCAVLAQFRNRGGVTSEAFTATLAVPAGMTLEGGSADRIVPPLAHGEYARVLWRVTADAEGDHTLSVSSTGAHAPVPADAVFTVTPALTVAPADYPPPPQPVSTDIDVCMYYFPGWGADGAWEPVRKTAPIRRPEMGYYNEGNPEIVDWQIKWARENGISCFLVDWYWTAGNRMLEHWFDAYREARYRDQLDVCIMWANHNPAGSHSREDWRIVVQHWIDRYFNLPAYYHINGKPAVYMWAPGLLRNDLGGSDEVRAALEEAQAMAQAAGYAGIHFGAVNDNVTPAQTAVLRDEGYESTSSYHEWGDAVSMSPIPNRARFEDVAATAEAAWDAREAGSSGLEYFPLVDTGWDSRPWHGDKSLVISGRTVPLFEQMLDDAKAWCQAHGKDRVFLGPANEWGEGSYIEPATEYGFGMYEAVRRVFATGDPASWPVNIAPSDIGRGPYQDFPPPPEPDWRFSEDQEGWWFGGTGIRFSSVRVEDGMLAFEYMDDEGYFDPIIMSPDGLDLDAAEYRYLVIEVSVGNEADPSATDPLVWELFWDSGSDMNAHERVTFEVKPNAGVQRIVIDLAEASDLWRGTIRRIRLDPGLDAASHRGMTVRINRIALLTSMNPPVASLHGVAAGIVGAVLLGTSVAWRAIW
jgi:hypothetical protein